MTLSEDDDQVVTAVGTPSAAVHLATRRLGTASAVGVVIPERGVFGAFGDGTGNSRTQCGRRHRRGPGPPPKSRPRLGTSIGLLLCSMAPRQRGPRGQGLVVAVRLSGGEAECLLQLILV